MKHIKCIFKISIVLLLLLISVGSIYAADNDQVSLNDISNDGSDDGNLDDGWNDDFDDNESDFNYSDFDYLKHKQGHSKTSSCVKTTSSSAPTMIHDYLKELGSNSNPIISQLNNSTDVNKTSTDNQTIEEAPESGDVDILLLIALFVIGLFIIL